MSRLFGSKVSTTETIVGIAIGAALFGVLMLYGGIPVYTNTKLTSAYIIPVIVGALYGPLAAGFSALLGNVFADFLGGYGYWFDWSIGNFVAGLFIGALPLYGANIRKGVFSIKHAIIFAVLTIVGQALAFGIITPIFTVLFFQSELTITYAQAWSAVASNVAVVLIIGIPLLFLLARYYGKQRGLSREQ